MYWEDFVCFVDKLGVFIIFMVVTVLGFILLYRGKLGKLEFGKALKISGIDEEANRIRARLSSVLTEDESKLNRQYALLQEYHAQGLAQSKISFWYSLLFATIGFGIIILSVLSYLISPEVYRESATMVEKAGKPIFAVVAGTIIDAVAGLFFVQSNKARQLMTDFFDKLRVDRKLDESLGLLSQIEDKTVSSRTKALLALNFAEVKITDDLFRRVVSFDGSTSDHRVITKLHENGQG